jgi:hypothetical protein
VGKDNGIAKQIRARVIPTTTFISKGGRIVQNYTGPINYSGIVSGIEDILR